MMNQMNLVLMLMMRLFENEVKVHVDVLIHFHRLVYVPMTEAGELSVE
jgi:hypothetical protein